VRSASSGGHPDAVLYVHAEGPAARRASTSPSSPSTPVPEHAIVWVDQYAYRTGFSAEMMAALLGVRRAARPVARRRVLRPADRGAGVRDAGHRDRLLRADRARRRRLAGRRPAEWDPAQHASYVCPFIVDIVAKLEEAYARRSGVDGAEGVGFAASTTPTGVRQHWRPFLASLEPNPNPPARARADPGPGVAVIVPAMRPRTWPRSSSRSTRPTTARRLYFVCVRRRRGDRRRPAAGATSITEQPRPHLREKVNVAFEHDEPWVLVVGDDVEFKPGWLDAARKLSDRFDVIGTNDTAGPVKNPTSRRPHADHFFVRRSYVDDLRRQPRRPGRARPRGYEHWWVDKEIVELAQGPRRVHPLPRLGRRAPPPRLRRREDREDLRSPSRQDPVYMQRWSRRGRRPEDVPQSRCR
jgi:hypothetical protein